MTVGLPGTGIGGVFYLLLVVLMPLRELVRLLRGRSNRHRWKVIATQWGYVMAIGLTLWLETRGMEALAGWARKAGWLAAETGNTAGIWGNGVVWAGLVALVPLAMVYVTIHLLRLILRWRRRPEQSAETAREAASQGTQVSEAASVEPEMVGAAREN
jgi:hypothetical protein